jgi:hypothetical protein
VPLSPDDLDRKTQRSGLNRLPQHRAVPLGLALRYLFADLHEHHALVVDVRALGGRQTFIEAAHGAEVLLLGSEDEGPPPGRRA